MQLPWAGLVASRPLGRCRAIHRQGRKVGLLFRLAGDKRPPRLSLRPCNNRADKQAEIPVPIVRYSCIDIHYDYLYSYNVLVYSSTVLVPRPGIDADGPLCSTVAVHTRILHRINVGAFFRFINTCMRVLPVYCYLLLYRYLLTVVLRLLRSPTQGVLRAAGAQAPRRGPRRGSEAPPEEPPGRAAGGDFFCDLTCTDICAKTKQQSAFKRLPNLEKACIMPWDVLEKKRADNTFIPDYVVRSCSYRVRVR